MRGSKKFRLEKQMRESKLRMEILDNSSGDGKMRETSVNMEQFEPNNDPSEVDGGERTMEKFEIENEEQDEYIYKVRNPLERLLSAVKRNKKIFLVAFILSLICLITIPTVVHFTSNKEEPNTTTTGPATSTSSSTPAISTTSIPTVSSTVTTNETVKQVFGNTFNDLIGNLYN